MIRISRTGRLISDSIMIMQMPSTIRQVIIHENSEGITPMIAHNFSNLEKSVAEWNGLVYDSVWLDELSPTCPARWSTLVYKRPKTKKLKPIRSAKPEVKKFYTPDWRK